MCPLARQITSERTLVQGRYQWVPKEKSDDASHCGCGAGDRLVNGACEDCGNEDFDGLICLGKDEVEVAPGFYAADSSFSIFKCHSDTAHCVGGKPGSTCAPGREGISCALCKPGLKAGADGGCVPCEDEGSGQSTFYCLFFVMLFAPVPMYVVVDRGCKSRPSHAILLMSLMFSLTITLVQQLGVVSLLEDVRWMDPISTLLDAAQLLMFDLEVLHVSCMFRFSPLGSFIVQLSILAQCVVVLLITHVLLSLFYYREPIRQRNSALVASIGTIFMVVYISVVTAVLGPFQCLEHPNGKWTIRGFPSVVCWETGEHISMIVVATVAVQVPLAFFAFCTRATAMYPRKMLEGNTWFLETYNWLFFRFRPEVHWYTLVNMGRSLVLALVPVIPHAPAQIICMQFTLVSNMMIVVGMQPWRLDYINSMDIFFTLSILFVLICASFYVTFVSTSVLAWFASIFIVICLLAFPLGLVAGAVWYLRRRSGRRDFEYFLCHHKAGAGAFTRLLKLQLKSERSVTREVFVDSDNLSSLDLLLEMVANSTETLVIVGSAEILLRPWCVGEITTAKAARLNMFKIALPDFVNPSDDFIDRYAEILQDMSVLTKNGIRPDDVREAMRHMRELEDIPVQAKLEDKTLAEVASRVTVKAGSSRASTQARTSSKATMQSDVKCAVIVDSSSWEAVSAAMVLVRILGPLFSSEPTLRPVILNAQDALPESTTKAVFICTPGALLSEACVPKLIAAGERQLPILPIIAEDAFQFPSRQFAQENCEVLKRLAMIGKRPEQRQPSSEEATMRRLELVTSCFNKTIGFRFHVKMLSDKMLRSQAEEIFDRLGHLGIGGDGVYRRGSRSTQSNANEPEQPEQPEHF
ncbi:unnamed protein product [Prorocentrum cordatum]|uniref:TIR domain-containing protein n=1 Tax=Prorocentrum cordatum TaxID=2364126 RepID=A0ABN9XA27_9DINO|nr:unnamed protein product [Polarella glacialis]